MTLAAELNSMQRWAYYGLVDDYLTNLLKEEPSVNELTTAEQQQLVELELTIEAGMQTFIDVGQALLTIRDHHLYRADYGSFDDYCRNRWGFHRAHAYRLIDAAQVVSTLRVSPHPLGVGDTPLPANESQARPLVGLPPHEQQAAWRQAVETAPGGKVTGEHVGRVVKNLYSGPMTQEMQVLLSHESVEWYTPPEYIKAAREVMDGIDLDPATAATPQAWIKATIHYTLADNGLVQPWLGRVWLNAPYSKTEGQSNQEIWANKLIEEYRTGRVTEAIMLVKASIGYNWFDRLFAIYPVCLVRGLISFIKPDGQINGPAKLGSALFYFGPNLARFEQVFSRFGRVIPPPEVL